jgi:hypothetical protein
MDQVRTTMNISCKHQYIQEAVRCPNPQEESTPTVVRAFRAKENIIQITGALFMANKSRALQPLVDRKTNIQAICEV